jgi:hypothetical protein
MWCSPRPKKSSPDSQILRLAQWSAVGAEGQVTETVDADHDRVPGTNSLHRVLLHA